MQAERGERRTPYALNTVPTRIKWMLDDTMDASGDFERRRQELSIMLKRRLSG